MCASLIEDMAKKKCIFCNKISKRSKEHIWPKWLQKHLTGDTKSYYRGTHISFSTVSVISDRTQTGESLVFGSICEDCNNGWMSNLEVEFKKIFLQIESDYNYLHQLNKIDRQTISIWGLKTAMMINAGTNYRQIIPNDHFEHLYKHRTPPRNTKVDIGIINTEDKLKWEQSNFQMEVCMNTKYEDLDPYESTRDSYIVTLQLKNLGIKISHYRDCKEKNYNIPESRDKKSIRVWPYRKNSFFKTSNYYEDIASMHSDTVIEK